MAETLTGSQRLRAFITGKVVRISDLEKILETRDTRITVLEASAETWQELDTANTGRITELEQSNKDTNDSLVKMG